MRQTDHFEFPALLPILAETEQGKCYLNNFCCKLSALPEGKKGYEKAVFVCAQSLSEFRAHFQYNSYPNLEDVSQPHKASLSYLDKTFPGI